MTNLLQENECPPHIKHICFFAITQIQPKKTKELNFFHHTRSKLKNYLYFWTESSKLI